MIAPVGGVGKGFLPQRKHRKTAPNVPVTITNSLNPHTKRPKFGQSQVTVPGENTIVASWPGSVRDPDSSAPQPPGARPAGPVEFRVRFNPQTP
jgi:hypothetical protein